MRFRFRALRAEGRDVEGDSITISLACVGVRATALDYDVTDRDGGVDLLTSLAPLAHCIATYPTAVCVGKDARALSAARTLQRLVSIRRWAGRAGIGCVRVSCRS